MRLLTIRAHMIDFYGEKKALQIFAYVLLILSRPFAAFFNLKKKKKWRQVTNAKKCYWSTCKNNRSECRTLLSSKKIVSITIFFSHKQAISYPSNVHKKGKIAIVDISHLDHFHHSRLPAWNGDCNEWEKNRAKISLLRHSYAIIMQFLVQWSLSYMVDTRLHFFLLYNRIFHFSLWTPFIAR
mgnify:CR=1 FL=1